MLGDRDMIVLRFLDTGRMEATTRQIGEELGRLGRCPGSYTAVGAGVANSLKKRGFVMRLSDLNAWRITRAGREALHTDR
jgi:hypothetical protein